ncbi:ElaA protein [Natronobacillus azotifigens]|uniref:GNAT family N-acetyltransferase n=1 Tax=Natronobacillus azotifigens TaxID=472978 RepID=A0A9J6RBV7_9BACI|nr:GNAT family N-acetyltransferase [Natronobacillus azotifigens]MCZ0702713.1 GNAT family N-acetyltransferase [Natronobacillus azotifigens]
MLEWVCKTFSTIDKHDWYEIAQLRTEVFIVEQKCNYQDFDGYDQMSHHVFLRKEGQIVAYMRLIPRGYFCTEASFGRVIVKKAERGQAYARTLVEKGIDIMQKEMNEPIIKIQAEAYLQKFYRSFGFVDVSEPYLSYDILHVDMILEQK